MILKKTTPGTGSGGNTDSSSYVIELARWGIQAGLPSKRIEVIGGVNVNCYADSDYVIARNNMLGFNNAFDWAKSQNYTRVIVPFGSYSTCYSSVSNNDKENRIVINQSNMSIDLNNSTFKVLFDSAKRSPYSKVDSGGGVFVPSTNPPYQYGGSFGPPTLMIVRDCNYTEVKNGKIIGDKIDRDFTLQDERAIDSTYGLLAGGNCKYINIENMDVGFFMGDALSISAGKDNTGVAVGYGMSFAVGDLDANTGALIASTTRCVSGYLAVSGNTDHHMIGYGYTQGMTALGSRQYTVYMYDANKAFISKLSTFVLREWRSATLARFVRIVVEEPTVDRDGWQMILQTGIKGSFLTFQNNYIHHNHRGGSSPGVNDMYIINNHFYKNGEIYDYDNNLPGAETAQGSPFSTRYHINMEDSQGFNMHVIGNKFESGPGGCIGIAARGYNWTIKDNGFKNCGVTLYRVSYATVKDNYFEGIYGGFGTFNYNTQWNSYQDFIRYWDIEGNVIEGGFVIYGNAVIKNISNNTISGRVMLECDVNSFRNNRFKVDLDDGFSDFVAIKTVSKIYGCTFMKSVQQNATKNHLQLENCILYNCSISNLKIRGTNITLIDSTTSDSGFDMSTGTLKFDGCNLSFGSTFLLNNNYAGTPDNSAIVNVSTSSTDPVLVEFKNSSVVSSSSQSIFGSQNSVATNAKLRLDNTKITRQVNNKLGLGVFDTFDFTNSAIVSDVAIPTYTPDPSNVHRFADNTFTNVTFNLKQSDIVYTQQDVNLLARPLSGSGAPSTVPQKLGQEYYDTTSRKLYKAFGTAATTDWVVMN